MTQKIPNSSSCGPTGPEPARQDRQEVSRATSTRDRPRRSDQRRADQPGARAASSCPRRSAIISRTASSSSAPGTSAAPRWPRSSPGATGRLHRARSTAPPWPTISRCAAPDRAVARGRADDRLARDRLARAGYPDHPPLAHQIVCRGGWHRPHGRPRPAPRAALRSLGADPDRLVAPAAVRPVRPEPPPTSPTPYYGDDAVSTTAAHDRRGCRAHRLPGVASGRPLGCRDHARPDGVAGAHGLLLRRTPAYSLVRNRPHRGRRRSL